MVFHLVVVGDGFLEFSGVPGGLVGCFYLGELVFVGGFYFVEQVFFALHVAVV